MTRYGPSLLSKLYGLWKAMRLLGVRPTYAGVDVMPGWGKPSGATGYHWFDTRAGVTRSACGTHPWVEGLQLVAREDMPGRRCWECSQNRCPTDAHPLGRCPGDHGK